MSEPHQWDDDLIREIAGREGIRSQEAAFRAYRQTHNVPRDAFRAHVRGWLAPLLARPLALAPPEGANPLDAEIHGMLKGKRKPVEIHGLADTLDVSPRRVREALTRLRADGFRVPDEADGVVSLEQVVYREPGPDQVNLHKASPKLLDGNVLRVGIVSDTHLSSKECALDELHAAYDVFEREGIEEVWHPGDWTAGLGIYRTQAQDLQRHTFEEQADHLEREYPKRKGIRTRGIAGNHDIEGEFGKIGANPVVALANRRDDIEFLGDYSAWIELPNGAWVHLLHGRGGMSYSFSYKAQKLADAYPGGRKPAALFCGHWHVAGWIEQRGVQIVWPGCFEWQTSLLKRIGLQPTVGFWIVEMTLADDGSLVRFKPELYRFWEGREVQAAA